MEIIIWSIEITRIELDAHGCQTFLQKISATSVSTKAVRLLKSDRYGQNIFKSEMWPKYKSDLKITYILKLCIIFSAKSVVIKKIIKYKLLNALEAARQKAFQNRFTNYT